MGRFLSFLQNLKRRIVSICYTGLTNASRKNETSLCIRKLYTKTMKFDLNFSQFRCLPASAMVILELEELQKRYFNHPGFNSNIISPPVTVIIETTLYNHTFKKLLLIKNVYESSGNVRVRINASFGSHLNISSVASLKHT